MIITLNKIVGGGQTLGNLPDGRKVFVWGGLPGEEVEIEITKKRSHLVQGVVTKVLKSSSQRVEPRDPDSYLSTSPWQIMAFDAEQHYKASLIEEALELHDIVLPDPIEVYSDSNLYEYRNKIEYSFWYDKESGSLDLAFFKRGSHGKIEIDQTSLAAPEITTLSKVILHVLRDLHFDGMLLKTLLIRCNRQGDLSWQLYVKDEIVDAKMILDKVGAVHPTTRGEIIFSNPKSPASVITKRLAASSDQTLVDTILDIPFHYATESFFQINLPVYEQALLDMKAWISKDRPVVDLYSGVGTIGLTIGGENVTLVEVDSFAVEEMNRNIQKLGRTKVSAILAASEKALEYINAASTIIVDPPRAGLHEDVVNRLLEVQPERIVYLSCNPVTQARDVARLAEVYGIRYHKGYNFFPRTPHIEHLVILDKKNGTR